MSPLISRPPSSPTVLVNTSFAFWSRWLLSPVTSRSIFEKSSEKSGSVPRSMKRSVPSSRCISPIWTSMVSITPLGLAGAGRACRAGWGAGGGRGGGGRGGQGVLGIGEGGSGGPAEGLDDVERAVLTALDLDGQALEAGLGDDAFGRPVEIDVDQVHALDGDEGMIGV